MKKLFVWISLLIVCACNKSPEVRITPPKEYRSPQITISQTIEGCRFLPTSNVSLPVDSSQADSAFTIYGISAGADTYDQPIDLTFTASVFYGSIESIEWRIGSDPTIRMTPSFYLTFRHPVGEINIQAIVKWFSYYRGTSFTDTINKKLTITSASHLLGSYRGINIDNPTDTFTITIGVYDQNVVADDTYRFIGIKNLFKDFPYNIPVNIATNGFGICQAPRPYSERYSIGDKYYSQVLGIGLLNKTKDSLIVNYNYIEFKDIISYENMKVMTKTFLARKL